MEWGYLLLETGEVFAGRRFGAARRRSVAELVFTNGDDRLFRDADRSQLLWADGGADLSSDRELRRNSAGF